MKNLQGKTNSPTKKPTNKMKEQYKNEEPTGEEKSPTQAPTYKIEQRYKYPTTSSPTKKPTKLPTQNPTIASNQDDITKVITSYEKVPGGETTGISTNSPTKKPTKIKATNNPTKSPTNKPKSTATKMPTPKIAIPKLQYANTEISCDVMTTFLKKRVIEKKVTESSLTPQVFQNKNTPQYKALNWMLNDDNLNTICVNNDDKVLQRYMAALFYFSTGGEYWLNQYDFLNGNTHECTWSNRMVCNDENYIMDIIFNDNNVTGVIPSEIDTLKSLKTLSLIKGNLTSTIPETLYNITSLQVLELSDNNLKGKLSNKIYNLQNLKVLNLNNNNLNGPIDAAISNLQNLSSLKLDNNKFYGLVRRELKDLVNAEIVTLHENNFSGRVPTRMCNLFKPGNGKLQTLTADCDGVDAKVECVCCTACY